MIYIDPNHPRVKRALDLHVSELLPFVERRVNKSKNSDLKRYLTKDKIKDILKSLPNELLNLNQHFYSNVRIHTYRLNGYDLYKKNLYKKNRELRDGLRQNRRVYNNLHRDLKDIFDYDSFVNKKGKDGYDGYKLADNLDIGTCIYCNRLYTKTVIDTKYRKKDKITRPEFDHWFPKSKYPLLALSFYNLIPSCHVCNSNLKGDEDILLDSMLHPYVNEIEFKDIKFSYRYEDSLTDYIFSIKHNNNDKIIKFIETFKIKEVYNTHKEELLDLIQIRDKYSNKYLLSLKAILPPKSISDEEIYRLAFGVYMEQESFYKRPLSKMKNDILIELGILHEKK